MNRRQLLIASTFAASGTLLRAESNETPPPPYGAIPSVGQLRWHALETNAFLHFTVNTFTDKEWGYGDEDPNVFAPTNFNADAIVNDLKAGGMKGVILTCKHHDGFCLWPTSTTEHSVRKSSWQDGKGDVVRDISAAAKRAGLRFGIYVSPWDRANPKYGTPAYPSVHRQQVRELLTNYGSIFEVWFDGANGGTGYYGGARENRTIDRKTYYEWPGTFDMIRTLQPDAVIFGPYADIRWVGNEEGIAGDPCWATYNPAPAVMTDIDASDGGRKEDLMSGQVNGTRWQPAECDVSIRPGWFWHEKENTKVKTPEQLLELYFDSVGRGGSMLLNVPPNREGRLQAADAASIAAFHQNLKKMFAVDLAQTAKLRASNIRFGAARFGPHQLLDHAPSTYWATDDAVLSGDITIDFRTAQRITVVRLREMIALGQRIRAFALDAWQDGEWKEITSATSIGACRLVRFQTPVVTSKLRLRIIRSDAPIALAQLNIF